jgi:hypothetical protein
MGSLRDLAIRFFGWLGAECLEAAATLAGFNADAPSERGGQAMREREMTRNAAEHPCPTCRGLCVLPSRSGAVTFCQGCRGYGVDVLWLAGVVER